MPELVLEVARQSVELLCGRDGVVEDASVVDGQKFAVVDDRVRKDLRKFLRDDADAMTLVVVESPLKAHEVINSKE